MDTVLILMSSYNGEKYIEEQIDSILSQEGVIVKLLVRDDGSKDATPKILERYKQQGKLDYYLGNNRGWRDSFMHLAINSPECDYYAFSDQDDKWLPEKLLRALETLKKMGPGPNLYTSNVRYWENGVDKGLSMPDVIRTDVYHSLLFCESFGCTMLFNRALMDIVKKAPPKISVAHDFWFMQVACILGEVYYDRNSYILYRQHDNNQLGYDKFFLERNKRRIDNYLHLFRFHELDIQAKELINCYGPMMTKENQDIVLKVANYRENLEDYLSLLFSTKYTHDKFLTNLGLKFRIMVRHI